MQDTTKKPNKDGRISINKLSQMTGVHRSTIKKYLDEASITPRNGTYDATEAISAIEGRKGATGGAGESQFARLARARAVALEFDNEVKRKVAEGKYVEADDVDRLIQIFIGALENVPSRLQSECGLSEHVVKRLTSLLDDARVAMCDSMKALSTPK